MKNIKIIITTACVLMCVCVAGCVFSTLNLIDEHQLNLSQHSSKQQTDDFLSSPCSNEFVNETALEKLNGVVKQQSDFQKPFFNYKAPEGFEFLSYSESWDEENLENLYNELMLNKHGEEIHTLDKVIVYGEDDDYALGYHQNQSYDIHFNFLFPTVPKSDGVVFTKVRGIIELYGGDTRTTAESMSATLSHEYGHHFTIYHILGEGSGEDTLYSRMRDDGTQHIRYVMDDYDDYTTNHQWYLAEILASDYVALMGSPTTRQIYDVGDTLEQLMNSWQIDYSKVQDCINTLPQENLKIPSPHDVQGLEYYFYSFIDEDPPEHLSEKKDIQIEIEKQQKTFLLKTGSETFESYEITFDKPYDDKGAIYTLICFDETSAFTMPIKTVKANEKPVAHIGKLTRETASTVYVIDDEIATIGEVNFVVSTVLSDGTVYISSPKKYNFELDK